MTYNSEEMIPNDAWAEEMDRKRGKAGLPMTIQEEAHCRLHGSLHFSTPNIPPSQYLSLIKILRSSLLMSIFVLNTRILTVEASFHHTYVPLSSQLRGRLCCFSDMHLRQDAPLNHILRL